jgi:hypothetical protein
MQVCVLTAVLGFRGSWARAPQKEKFRGKSKTTICWQLSTRMNNTADDQVDGVIVYKPEKPTTNFILSLPVA